MKAFFKFFAERHLLANVLTIMVVLLGLASAMRINRSIWPNVKFGVMWITTRYPGASPEDVELNVTNKLENELKSVVGVKRMTSVSMENLSRITVIIDENVPDQEKVKTKIREAVARVTDLPSEITSTPHISEDDSSMESMLEIGISGDMPYPELREYARIFEKKLKNVPGVIMKYRLGYRAREIKVEVSPDKMMKYQIPMHEIVTAIRARNIRASGGSLESYTSEKNVVTLAQFRDPQEVGDVIIRSTLQGAMVRVKDLALIHDDFQEERSIPRINGKTTISFMMTKNEQADVIETVDAIRALVEKEKRLLAADSKIKFVFSLDFSKFVRNKFQIVRANGIIGLILVLVVLSLFLNVRSSFWVAMGIPFTLLGVLFLLPLFDVDLDSITLTSMVLVLGIIVDDAIVISENIFQRREKGEAPLLAAVNGVHDVFLPVLTTITTTFLAFFPMFFMKGKIGQVIYVVPLTITLALGMSLFESFFILPAHLIPGLQSKKKGKSQSFGRAWFIPLRSLFEKFTQTALRLRYLWVVMAIVFLAGSLFYAATSMDFVLFSNKGVDAFSAQVELPIGTSLQATSDKIKEIEAILEGLPKTEVESYSFFIGGQTEHRASFTVYLTPYSARERTASEIVEDVRHKTDALEGFKQITFGLFDVNPSTGKPVEIRIVGSDDVVRKRLARDIVAFLNTIGGVKDVDRNDKPGKEEVAIQINYERLARYGLTVADISQNVRIAYDGEIVTSTRYGEEDVEFRVMIQKEYRQQLSYLRQLRIPNRQGELIALDEVAKLDIGPGSSVFFHYDGERTVTVSGDVFQEKITPLEATSAVLQHFNAEKLSQEYPGVRIDFGGEAEESRKAMIDLFITFGLAALGIYFLLMLLFNSVTQPFMVILSIPFGICGVIIAFALHGEPLSFLGMLGVVGMAGVVVNDSLVMVDHLNGLKRTANNSVLSGAEGAFANTKEMIQLIASGTANRLRPVILTTVTTVAGLLPLAYGLGGEDIMMGPMALALGYGLLFATPITLVLVPSLYMIGYDIRKLLRRSLFTHRQP